MIQLIKQVLRNIRKIRNIKNPIENYLLLFILKKRLVIKEVIAIHSLNDI